MSTRLDPEFLKILICPLSRASLLQDGDTLVSTDAKTRRRYHIVDGIPDLLIDDSEELSEAEWKSVMDRCAKA
ncbi:hypothetical protein EHM69_00055 [candidate division KSB1 bacterium]|nr:MAG: hypothetical protein EHM69_05640 [candidate division KSB1 bacterium]RPH97053.1 MAG: hypothetical protein EHM69_00055 [candidate division KSB1 bacterium]